MPMSGDKQLEERRKYVRAFNATMIKIWREQISLLGVIDTGALYRSTMAVRMTADGKFTQITLAQSFNAYGIFVDYGTGPYHLTRSTIRSTKKSLNAVGAQSGEMLLYKAGDFCHALTADVEYCHVGRTVVAVEKVAALAGVKLRK